LIFAALDLRSVAGIHERRAYHLRKCDRRGQRLRNERSCGAGVLACAGVGGNAWTKTEHRQECRCHTNLDFRKLFLLRHNLQAVGGKDFLDLIFRVD
jgi:hypothetical protein